ncbi:ABC transporter ATP-binding protein, partial [Mesorhizobium sp. M7A.F.Ca.US.005.03.2.1]
MPMLPPNLPMLFRAFGKRQLRLLPAVVILGLVSAVLEGFGIGLIIPLLGIIMGHGDAAGMAGFSAVLQHVGSGLSERDRLIVISAAILGSIILKNVFAFANTLLTTFISGKASHSIRSALPEQLLRVGSP